MSRPVLSIIIVSYNTKELTAQTIYSIPKGALQTSYEIIVVDNNSTDGSVRFLHETFLDHIQLIAREDNGGFAVANNEGIKYAKGDYILLLNSDTIVQSNSLDYMVAAMQKHPSFGIISCTLLNSDASFQPQGGDLPTLINIAAWWLWPIPGQLPLLSAYQDASPLSPHKEIVERGWVGGAALLMRREVYEQIGGLDENIFMYAEDVEYCLQAKKNNWKVGLCPQARIVHLGSASSSSSRAKIGEIRGLLYVFGKHTSPLETLCLRGIFLMGALLRYFLFGILYQSPEARHLYGQVMKLSLQGSV